MILPHWPLSHPRLVAKPPILPAPLSSYLHQARHFVPHKRGQTNKRGKKQWPKSNGRSKQFGISSVPLSSSPTRRATPGIGLFSPNRWTSTASLSRCSCPNPVSSAWRNRTRRTSGLSAGSAWGGFGLPFFCAHKGPRGVR